MDPSGKFWRLYWDSDWRNRQTIWSLWQWLLEHPRNDVLRSPRWVRELWYAPRYLVSQLQSHGMVPTCGFWMNQLDLLINIKFSHAQSKIICTFKAFQFRLPVGFVIQTCGWTHFPHVVSWFYQKNMPTDIGWFCSHRANHCMFSRSLHVLHGPSSWRSSLTHCWLQYAGCKYLLATCQESILIGCLS
jgi:hypothetical protein